jgi:predicted ATPase/class 3 adenylate cyclase
VHQLPSGTVTFLLTDIEGSTRRWQQDEPAMRAALMRHDAIIRDSVRAHGGAVIKHTGDGMLAVFAVAADAIGAAVDAQRALTSADFGPLALAVRMAVHSGDAHERDGDYFGPTLNRVARLLAAAHGGQVLVSQAATVLSIDFLPRGIELVDVGEHHLRDLDRPERIRQVAVDGLAREFPPLRTAAGELHGFPTTRTRLIGRGALLAQIGEQLSRTALLTLTGVGGSGKTRVAIEAGRREGPRFSDGAAFVDLSPLGDPNLIAQTVASAVGVADPHTSGQRSTEEDLVAYLRRRRMLVILDNCEHLIERTAELADRLLAECPELKLIATSREGLAVEGESLLVVPPLALPRDGGDAAQSEAVQLFVERAGAARPELDLLGRHEAAVVDVCRRLDGIPLALELAAAQIAHFTPEEVAERLDDRFRLLAGARRRVQRQATLRAAVDWSYELLDEPERMLLARLGVFAGDFSLRAVEGICAGDGIDSEAIVTLLAGLVAKSLVVAAAHGSATRYRLLETIRIYAEERLVERGEAERIRDRHRDWFLAWVEGLDVERLAAPHVRRISDLVVLETEIDNLRAALAWAESGGRADLIARFATAADVLWSFLSHQDEGLRWFDAAQPALEGDAILAARAIAVSGWVSMVRGDFLPLAAKAQSALAAVAAAEQLEPQPREVVGALLFAGLCLTYSDPAAGRPLMARARAIAAARGLAGAAVRATAFEGMLWLAEGRVEEATAALEVLRQDLDPERARFFDGAFLSELVIAHHIAAHHEQAIRVATDLAQMRLGYGDPMTEISVEACYILARAGAGRTEPAVEELLGLLARARRDALPVLSQYMLTLVAAVLTLRAEYEIASMVLAAARAPREGRTADDVPFRTAGHLAIFRHYGHLLMTRLAPDVVARCRNAGACMSLDAAADLVRRSLARQM